MVSGSLALLYFLLGFHGGRQGSGLDRGRSLVEWGDFPSVHLSVCLSVCSFIPPSGPFWLAGPQVWQAGPQAWLDGPEGEGRDGCMNIRKITPFYRTSSPIGAAALLQPNFNPKTV